jgi:hypothetical protein
MGRLQNNPSIVWVHSKSTHACPLAWGNKNFLMSLVLILPQIPYQAGTGIRPPGIALVSYTSADSLYQTQNTR